MKWDACRLTGSRWHGPSTLRRDREYDIEILYAEKGSPVPGLAMLQCCRRAARRSTIPLRRIAGEAQGLGSRAEAWWKGAIDLMFPPVCADCGLRLAEAAQPWQLCRSCRELLQSDAQRPVCPRCGLPRPAAPARSAVCLECRQRRFRFNRVVALGLYRGHLRQAVVRMKQFHEFALTAAVGRLLLDQLERQLEGRLPPVIVPIPKYWVKRLLRGTNTADVLAETLAGHASRPNVERAIRCRKPTRKQSLLGKTERQRNLSGALQLVEGYDLRGADVLIVDDIMTTGATANEAARVMARAGAQRITVAVVARAARGREFPPDAGRAEACGVSNEKTP